MLNEQLYNIYQQHPVISTDTRKIIPGSLFFALKGEKFDANTFAQQALDLGAAYAIVDNEAYRLNDRCLLVDDVLTALQDLARHHRRQLHIPVIGLTGSNGKTTTKELIYAVLATQFTTLATQGNLNNHIGVPLTILSISQTHEMAVIEMGANHQKEIELLCSIAQPDYGLITNVGKAHLEGFGGVEGVKKGKGELYDYLNATGGTVFVNSDSDDLMLMLQSRGITKAYRYGKASDENYVSGTLTGNMPFLSLKWRVNDQKESFDLTTQLTGEYNLPNILAAICIGTCFKLDPDLINQGISNYEPKNNRSQITKTAHNTLICDYYNANPSSMAVAIDNLGKMPAEKKVMILGDMFELGDEAGKEHEVVLNAALAVSAQQRIFIGKEFFKYKERGSVEFYETTAEAISALKASPIKSATILIKGSRSMALEKLVELL